MKVLVATIALVFAASIAGCGGTDPDQEEHAHHEFPEHRPGNFKETVSAISQRSWELANRGGKIGSLEFGHFVDIINWIPEMAADSALKKAEWEQAQEASKNLASLVLDPELDIKQLESVVADDLAVLKALVPKAGEPEPDLYHHDDHHHHHDH